MIVFDLREEARMVSYLYLVGGIALFCGVASVFPRSIRNKLPQALAESIRPLAVIFTLAAAIMLWMEYDERRQADELVEQCLHGGCKVAEGTVHDVVPARLVGIGRFNQQVNRGSFMVGEHYYGHDFDAFSSYSPTSVLRNGDKARVHSREGRMVLVERVGR